jgi:hypothetical protein
MNNAIFVWTISDVIGLIVLSLFFVFAVIPISIILIKIELRKFFCKHEKYEFYESSKCDAICINWNCERATAKVSQA